jgi:O-antigen/teichoic acid export membrane protein
VTTSTSGPERSARDVNKQIRGSSLLLVGKVLSVLANLIVQVLIVRYLGKSEFGAFAYAMSLVTTASTVITLGLDRGITRFVSIYDEQGAFNKLYGTIALQLGTIASLGLASVILVLGLQGWLGDSVIGDRQAVSVLVVLIVLAPIQAYDSLMVGLFAVFARPRAIFFRRHVLTPVMRLVVAALLLLGGGGPRFLAAGYVVTGLLGCGLYTYLLYGMFKERGLIDRLRETKLSYPLREVFGFTLPLLASDGLFIVLNTADAVMLGRYGGNADVAAYRVIVPPAKMNQLVLTTFGLLFTPLAARMFARGDRAAISHLYWQTAVWVAVFSFPMFALTFSLSTPLTVLLFGERYESSGTYLALLAAGYYVSAATGFNSTTLKVVGRLKYILLVSLGAAVLNLVLNILLVPAHGPLGAAIAGAATLIVYNVLNQLGLSTAGIERFSLRYTRVYVVIIAGAVGLFVLQSAFDPPLAVGVLAAGVVSLLVFRAARRQLEIADTFPEVLRFPLVGRLLGGKQEPSS